MTNQDVLAKNLRLTFLLNLSFLLEPLVRIKLYAALRNWVEGKETNFKACSHQLSGILSSRNKLARSAVPSYGLSRALASLGFFSLSESIADRKKSRFYRADKLMLFLSLKLRKDHKWRAISLENHIFKAGLEPFENMDIALLSRLGGAMKDNTSTPVAKERVCLILGPGETNPLVSNTCADIVLILLTPSKDLQILETELNMHKAFLVINGEICAALLSENHEHDNLRAIVVRARGLYCPPQHIASLAEKLDIPAASYASGFLDLWSYGSPNLLPRAISVAIAIADKVIIDGADLHTGETLYRRAKGKSVKSMTVTNDRPQFFTCNSLASHDPLWAFFILKGLRRSQFIVGNRGVLDLLDMSGVEYLEKLDDSVGKPRR